MSFTILGIAWIYPVSPSYVGATVYLETLTLLVGSSDVIWFVSSESPCSCLLEMCLHSRNHWRWHPHHLKTQAMPKSRCKCHTSGTILWFCLVEAWQHLGSRCVESNVSVLTQMVLLSPYVPPSFICCLSKESAEGKKYFFDSAFANDPIRAWLMNEPSRHCCSNISDK